MGALQEIVNVNIVVQNSGISVASFNTPMYLGLHKVFAERHRVYASVQELLDDGFDPNSQEVIVATAVFAQDVTVEQLVIGRRHADDIESITPSPVSNSTLYTVTINGTDFDFTSDVTATAAEIVAGLVAAINAGSEPVTAIDNGGSLALTPDVAGVDYTVTTTENLTVVVDDYDAGTESLTAAISAVRAEIDTWYGLIVHTHVEADVLEVAAVIESMDVPKLYGFSTQDADVITSATTDVLSLLQDLEYDRTFGLYDPDADAAFPEAAWFGVMLAKEPGEATWMFKTLVGQDADAISTTQRGFVNGKNGNTYEEIGGVSITREGKVASGEYIDVIVGIDWLTARMTERIFDALVVNDKIPYTQEGVTIIESLIRAQLRDAIEQGVIAEDPAFTIEVPTVSEISSIVKATRQLPAIEFTATLQGAIHKVTVNGTVTV